MPKLKAGEKYLSGQLDLGVFGRLQLVAFKNDSKKKEREPDLKLYYKDPSTGRLRRAGAFWVCTKRETEELTVEEEKVF